MDTLLLNMLLEGSPQIRIMGGDVLIGVCRRHLPILNPDSPSILKLFNSLIIDYCGRRFAYDSLDRTLLDICVIVMYFAMNSSAPQSLIDSNIYRNLIILGHDIPVVYCLITISNYAYVHHQSQVTRHLVEIGVLSCFINFLEKTKTGEIQASVVLGLRAILDTHRDYRRTFNEILISDSVMLRVVPAGWSYDSDQEDEWEEQEAKFWESTDEGDSLEGSSDCENCQQGASLELGDTQFVDEMKDEQIPSADVNRVEERKRKREEEN
jgi:hypothetical protein